MDDRWRDTYDAWKLRAPYDDDGPYCDCGCAMVSDKYGWHCERCDDEANAAAEFDTCDIPE